MVGYVDRIYTLFDGRAMMSRACMIDCVCVSEAARTRLRHVMQRPKLVDRSGLRRHHLRLLAHTQYTSAIGLEGIVHRRVMRMH
jgi:hypothetical protein